VGNYLRGQLLISGIAAFNVSVLLLLLDVPFALLIGLVAGLLNLIPNLGALITMILGVMLMFIFGDPWYWDVLKVVAVLLGQGIFESSVLTPKIMSHQVGLHPVLILLSLFVFGYFMGIFGLLIAVPATAILMTIYKTYRDDMTMELLATQPRPPSWFQRRAFRRKKATLETSEPPSTPKSEN
jgi:predicted PurR-regulated permease PerM